MFIINIIKNLLFFTGSYSNSIFPEPLSSQEEQECIIKMQNGDKDARNKLIEHNLRLVAHIVKKIDTKGQNTDDLISIGTIGLIKGIDTYKANDKTKITTYAARCIQNEILMYFRSTKKNNLDVSLNDSIGYDKDGNEISLMDIIKDKTPDMIDIITKKDNIDYLKRFMSILSGREKIIIIHRYGLYNTKAKTQREIAKEMNISRSYVSRIEKRALSKMLREFIKMNQY